MKQYKFFSIKTKLVAIIVPVVVLIVLLLVLTSYYVSSSSIKSSANNLLDSSVENQSNEIEAWLNSNLSTFQAVKTTFEATTFSNRAKQLMLNQYYNYNSNFPDGFYLADENGNVMKASKLKKSITGSLNSKWYKDGLTHINMGYGNAYINENGESVISASGIVKNQLGKIMVLSTDLSLERIGIIVNSYIQMEGAQSLLINKIDGTILACRDSSLVSTKLNTSNKDKFLKTIANRLEDRNYATSEIGDYMTAFENINGTDWILISYIPVHTVLANVMHLRNIMLLISAISILLLIILISYVVHVVTKPVKYLTRVIETMAEGDFTIEVNCKGNDEISVMSNSIKKFIQSVRGMILDITEICSQLRTHASGSDFVSQEMYAVSETQAFSMQELNDTVDQLACSVNEIASNATTLALVASDTRTDSVSVNNKMEETVDLSERGRINMQKVSCEMELMNHNIRQLGTAINRVGTVSSEISTIVNLIGGMAEQSNLLSLNASIEAARAGEAGKGFAVVADEIRKYAQTSAESVKSITNLVDEIQQLINDAVNQSNESTITIEENSKLINGAIESIDTIFENINETEILVKEMVNKIGKVDEVASSVAALTQEQAAGSEEILSTSENMVQQASNITKSSNEVAVESKQLAYTSEKLEKQIKKFKL